MCTIGQCFSIFNGQTPITQGWLAVTPQSRMIVDPDLPVQPPRCLDYRNLPPDLACIHSVFKSLTLKKSLRFMYSSVFVGETGQLEGPCQLSPFSIWALEVELRLSALQTSLPAKL